MTTTTIPSTYRALVQHTVGKPLTIEDVPTPTIGPGSVLLSVLAAGTVGYTRDVFDGTRPMPSAFPKVPGGGAVGRVLAVGPDATSVRPGQLVFFDPYIRARDDPNSSVISGFLIGPGPGSAALMEGEWRNSSYAQLIRAPLENVHVLDEARYLGKPENGGLGLTPAQLSWTTTGLISLGGLRAVGVQPGETVIVAPATASMGAGAVRVALALGARVIAMGRNKANLALLKKLSDRVHTVEITGDHEGEVAALARFGKADVFLDISPGAAEGSTYQRSALFSLRRGGRMAAMGVLPSDISFPAVLVAMNEITIRGKYMYEREDIVQIHNLIERGLLDLSKLKVRGTFPLEQWKEAFDEAAEATVEEVVALVP